MKAITHSVPARTPAFRQRGISIVELLIASAVGLIIVAAVTLVFIRSREVNRAQFQAALQLENGRYATETLFNELRLAGFYGEFGQFPRVPTALPDPCAPLSEGDVAPTATSSALAFYVQGSPAATLTAAPTVPAGCAAVITAAGGVSDGSDIVVVRRMHTAPLLQTVGLASGATRTALTANTDVYAQTDGQTLNLHYGGGTAATRYSCNAGDVTAVATNAKGVATILVKKDLDQPTTCDAGTTYPKASATIRKMLTYVFFVSGCRSNATLASCPPADRIPTLKRLEVGATTPTATDINQVTPLVEGIEFMKVRYGLDKTCSVTDCQMITNPANPNGPQIPVDGAEESVVDEPTALADWQQVVMAEIRMLARNPEATTGYTDVKQYDLGGASFTPSGGDVGFKRHLFKMQARIINVAGRRER